MPGKVVVVPDELHIESIARVIEQAIPYDGHHDQVTFNLQDLRFIHPSGIVVLASLAAWLSQERECRLEIIPPLNGDVQRYLSRMDFYCTLGMDVQEDFRRYDAAGRFQEMVWLRQERGIDEVAAMLVQVISANICLKKSIKHSLQISIAEVGSNVFHHGRSPIGGLICAQKYPQKGFVELAVADCGIGIRAAMSQRYGEVRSPDSAGPALEKAIQRGTTSRPEHNSGGGLFFTTEVIRNNGGRAFIQSERAMLVVSSQGNAVRSQPYWQGTIVCLQFELDSEADMISLFNHYFPPEDDYGLDQ